MIFQRLSLFFLCAGVLVCQDLHLGVQGGVPFGDFFRVGVSASHFGFADYTSAPVRYTLGPTVEVGLPRRLSLTASALYQRFHYSDSGLFATSSLVQFAAKTTGNAWSFPILLEWRPLQRYPVYFGAGPVIRHLGSLHQVVNSELFAPGSPPFQHETSDNPQDLKKSWYPGLQVAGGWNCSVPRIRISPEIRYTRWTANIAGDHLPLRFPANQIELLAGITYAASWRPDR